MKLYVPLKSAVYPPATEAVAPGLSKIVSDVTPSGHLNLAVKWPESGLTRPFKTTEIEFAMLHIFPHCGLETND
jgi:hypothetical protein